MVHWDPLAPLLVIAISRPRPRRSSGNTFSERLCLPPSSSPTTSRAQTSGTRRSNANRCTFNRASSNRSTQASLVEPEPESQKKGEETMQLCCNNSEQLQTVCRPKLTTVLQIKSNLLTLCFSSSVQLFLSSSSSTSLDIDDPFAACNPIRASQ